MVKESLETRTPLQVAPPAGNASGTDANLPIGTDKGAHIQIDHVSHRFGQGEKALPVLKDVSLDIKPGEFVAVLGPSGSGKSTLLRLVSGLEKPSEGTILADGKLVTGPDPSRIVMFQDPTLYPWRTVEGNVALGLEARGKLKTQGNRVGEAIDLVGLQGFEKAYPRQLSGGMAQRAALARALVNDPRLLILDEPFGKLDSLTRLTMQGELLKLWQRERFTTLLVTHDVEEALFLAQRVIVFGQRPAQIKAEFKVDLPYPRHRGDPALAALRQKALAELGLDADW
ncbi:ABC transporter ATP-binding protein [Oecophyllibacter saccharovorans]|uniref:ABC transporter ATP-binding protein n=1 Tax=Oecophyllibacter saccharovorans TaxID=2558360 RepID=UPI001142BBC1|nr:ABC transporter ATP-binding protein [Oecophyllibacter saccharovorans]QDH15240.1 ABC transporter ATP-binding protein [Oecophyllibacter saccharovorans]TPW36256.1 ABC transporter ATP-binding protein [Oecophyllibacter saccharovorans]